MVIKSERDILGLGESLYNARKPHKRGNDYNDGQKERDGKIVDNS